MSDSLPRYYAVNDRPVALIPTENGGADVVALDLRTGVLKTDRSYFERISEHGKDVDSLTQLEFELRVQEIRKEICIALANQSINWIGTHDGEFPYQAELHGSQIQIRVNDFPAEPLYSVLVDGQNLSDLEDWPAAWTKPAQLS